VGKRALTSFKAVVFDMDGVLIDARDWHFRALNEALGIFGAAISHEEHEADFDGLPTRVKLERLTEQGRLPQHVHTIVNSVKQERTLRTAALLCFPRIEHLLAISWLKAQGLKVGVATNSIRASAEAMLEFAAILPEMDCLVTNEDVERDKPYPDIYLRAARQISVARDDALVVEDLAVGVAAAEAAGCQVIQVDSPDDVSIGLFLRRFQLDPE
jgi:beta-phosphoglucomutase-like phosphatase (HAD superfamily)